MADELAQVQAEYDAANSHVDDLVKQLTDVNAREKNKKVLKVVVKETLKLAVRSVRVEAQGAQAANQQESALDSDQSASFSVTFNKPYTITFVATSSPSPSTPPPAPPAEDAVAAAAPAADDDAAAGVAESAADAVAAAEVAAVLNEAVDATAAAASGGDSWLEVEEPSSGDDAAAEHSAAVAAAAESEDAAAPEATAAAAAAPAEPASEEGEGAAAEAPAASEEPAEAAAAAAAEPEAAVEAPAAEAAAEAVVEREVLVTFAASAATEGGGVAQWAYAGDSEDACVCFEAHVLPLPEGEAAELKQLAQDLTLRFDEATMDRIRMEARLKKLREARKRGPAAPGGGKLARRSSGGGGGKPAGGAKKAVEKGFLNKPRRKAEPGALSKLWSRTAAALGVTQALAMQFKNPLIFGAAVAFMTFKGDTLAV
ncbi:hypothetical protein JKP88DRAFT_266850 [Tribonema minus]|uniref:Uncharacterized protein n=1 Tax=Tribonema minus TaxID=303371 RepID=A0A835ZKG0_9STRA|nr:hypothetical protein JKP88DRAFT_266850 [Tribonema minus]